MTRTGHYPGLPEWEQAFRSEKGKALLEKVLKTIRTYKMFRKGDRVVVAVSGGGDSVFLLGAMLQVRAIFDLEIHVAHIHHGLRDDADQDAVFVEEWTRQLGVPFDVTRLDLGPSLGRGANLEETARTFRYQALENIRQSRKARRIAVGHTLTDSVETFLFHLARGTGFRGLAGIPPVRPPIVRPLIALKRQEIREFLQTFGIPFREDPTNQDLQRTRNFIRLEVLPLLEQRFPGIQEHIGQLMTLHREFQDLLLSQIPEKTVLLKYTGEHLEVLDLPRLRILHPAVLRGFLHETYGLDYRETEEVMVKIRQGGRVQTRSAQFWASFDDLAVFFPPYPPLRLPARPWRDRELRFPEINVRLVQHIEKHCTIQTPWEICFPVECVDTETLEVRSWRPGDVISVLGAPRKLKEIFQGHRVPAWRRGLWPVVADRQGILWIVGLVSGDRPGRHRSPWIKMEVKKDEPNRPWIFDF